MRATPYLAALGVQAAHAASLGQDTCLYAWTEMQLLVGPGQVCAHNSTCTAACQGNVTNLLVACANLNYTNAQNEVLSFDQHVESWMDTHGPLGCNFSFASCDGRQCTPANLQRSAGPWAGLQGCVQVHSDQNGTATWDACPGVSSKCRAAFATLLTLCGGCQTGTVKQYIDSAASALPACDGSNCRTCRDHVEEDIRESCGGHLHPPICDGGCQDAVLSAGRQCPRYFLDDPDVKLGIYTDCNGTSSDLQQAASQQDIANRAAKCNNHGSWQDLQCVCQCDSGFAGLACETSAESHASKLPAWAVILLAILATVVVVVAVGAVWKRRQSASVSEIQGPLLES